MTRIALIEDDKLLLKRMALFLSGQKGMQCVLTAESLGQFFETLPEKPQVDLLLADIELSSSINTIDHLEKVRKLLPAVKILVITGHSHPDYILRALQKGVNGFYLKGSGLDKLVEAIETICSGGAYLAPEAAAHMVPFFNWHSNSQRQSEDTVASYAAPGPAIPIKEDAKLSRREKEVAWRLIEGQSYQDIASELSVSLNTVRHYVKSLYKKFGVSNKIQLSRKMKPYF